MIYRIDQDNYSDGFRKIISNKHYYGIQNVPNGEKWYWDIDTASVNPEKILADFQNNYSTYYEICQKFVNDINSFQDFIKNAESNADFEKFRENLFSSVSLDNQRYYVIGDIVNGYMINSHNSIMFDFLDNHQKDNAIKLFISNKTIIQDQFGNKIFWNNLKEARIAVYAQSYFNSKRGEIQLDAISVNILGPCSREAVYNELAELYPAREHQELSLDNPYPHIALIAGDNHGKKDFDSKINKKLKEKNCIKFVKTNMSDIQAIVSVIEEENHQQDVDIIAIVRGGGNVEDMCIYNNKLLLDAVRDSKIPIITGIGHEDDQILAKRVAVYGASTPTDAANYINRIIGKFWDKDKKIRTENKQKSYLDLKEENQNLEEENQNLKEENQQLKAEIKRLKNRGIFSRLVNR